MRMNAQRRTPSVGRPAQSVAEYAILLALAVSIFVGMQTYVKRGLQGRLRDASGFLVTSINKELGTSQGPQYEPEYRGKSTSDNVSNSIVNEAIFKGGGQNNKSANYSKVDSTQAYE